MKAVITGETDNLVGVNLRDNNGVEHVMDVRKSDGEIPAHQQYGYPDNPDERTEADNEHVNQARRFAQYWAYRKRGYDTLNKQNNPDRITVAALALMALTPDAAETYLGDLYGQLISLYTDRESTVDVPDEVAPERAIYEKDIYVGIDQEDASTYATVLTNSEIQEQLDQDGNKNIVDTINTIDTDTLDEISGVNSDDFTTLRDGLLVEATSGIHVHWDDVDGQYHTQWGDQPEIDRDPDARIEILSYKPESIAELTKQIVRHLLCQVRDCYLAMGIAPPEQFRLLGYGRQDASTWYANYDFYENYHDPTADIGTWFEEHTPDNAYNTTVETEEPAQTNN